MSADPRSELTAREWEILELIADGHSNSEIGQMLFVSAETVKSHVRHILAKTGSRTRAQAVHRAHLRGWFGTRPSAALNAPSQPQRWEYASAPCT